MGVVEYPYGEIIMQIELPEELMVRVRQRTAPDLGVTESDVIKEALDLLDWADQDNPSEAVLNHSLHMIDRSMADIAAGRVLSIADAKQRALDALPNSGQ
jgi:Arc/MetJ-type ribon-helix-helix transcriptional regulator